MSIFEHQGHWDDHSRQSPALKFLEGYGTKVDTCDLSTTPPSTFYAPNAVFHDTTNNLYIGAPTIWDWMKGLFAPFSHIHHEGVHFLVVPRHDGASVVYAEFLTRFYFLGDSEPVEVPRFFVFVVGKSEGREREGFLGLQIREVRLFWDTGLLEAHLKKSA